MPARRSWSSISATRDMRWCSVEFVKVADPGLRNIALAYQRTVGDAAAKVRDADVDNQDLMARELVVDTRAHRDVIGRLAGIFRAPSAHFGRTHTVIVIDIFAAQPIHAGVDWLSSKYVDYYYGVLSSKVPRS